MNRRGDSEIMKSKATRNEGLINPTGIEARMRLTASPQRSVAQARIWLSDHQMKKLGGWIKP